MRLTQRSAFGFILGGGFAIAGGLTGVACSGNDFDGCAAARNCAAPAAGTSGFSSAGHDGESAGGKAGQGGASGSAGRSSAGTSANAQAGEAGAGSGGEGAGEGPDAAGTAGADATGGRPSGSGGSDARGGAAGEDGRDQTAPAIMKVTPANGATGVAKDASIVVEFGESMDEETTEAAFSSNDLPHDAVEFSWQDHDKTLVIRPKVPLAYAATDLDGDAKHYVFTIAGTATDTAGNRLGADRTSYFTTLRDVTQTLTNVVTQNYAFTDAPIAAVLRDTLGVTGRMALGDDTSDRGLFAITTFDLTSVPAGIVSWERASVAASLEAGVGNPFGDDVLGALRVLSSTADPTAFTRDIPAIELGVLATSESQMRVSLDITGAVVDDYAHLAERNQVLELMFKFQKRSNKDATEQSVLLDCAATELTLEYLLP